MPQQLQKCVEVDICHVGSRELSEKAEALVLIWMEWPSDTGYCDGRLLRDSRTWSDRSWVYLGVLTVNRLSLA